MRSCILVLVLLAVPALAPAQHVASLPRLDAGTRVRIWSDTTTAALKVRVQSVDEQGRTIGIVQDGNARVLASSDLHRIDVSRGRNRWLWTGGGMLVGAAVGIIISRADNDPGDMIGGIDETAEGLANTVTGALIGGVAGFFVAPERWRTVWRR